MPEEEKLRLTRMEFFDIMANAMYVFGGEEDKPVDVEEMIDYIRSVATLVTRSKKAK